MVLICTAVGLVGAQAMEGNDEAERIQSDMAIRNEGASHWKRESAYTASAPGDVPLDTRGSEGVATEGASDLATPEPVLDEPEPTPEPVAEYPDTPAGSIEQAIIAYPWEDDIALRVAACESGPDYMAGYNGSGHAGTFQVSPIHAWRFAARGLDFWTDATDLGANIDVAYEIWTERWWYAWSCF